MRLARLSFWTSAGLLAYAHAGYPLLLAALAGARRRRARRRDGEISMRFIGEDEELRVALLVAAHDEEATIADWVESARELDHSRGKLLIVVASDGSRDATAERARAAGADLVLELERAGKVAALNAAVAELERRGEDVDVLAFADANSRWEPDALIAMRLSLHAEPRAGYICGQLRYDDPSGDNQEGLYWRYEMRVRELESELAGITAGNGAINAVRREAFIALEPDRGQDISLPFELTKRGWRAVYQPAAVAYEPMASTIEGELGRKRRMLTGAWRTLLSTGMLSPRGYPPLYWLQILSHRLLRYASPLLHVTAATSSLRLARSGRVYAAAFAAQAALLVAAAAAKALPLRPLRIARYYVAVTAASALGLWDYLRQGTPVTWDQAPGTREP